jgi:prepilin-type N-terminal cleavage/methylation domain-containing protein/prepilin-type processing-associated H-X9-DG protein
MQNCSRRAFSLIELLVVIAIIVILVAILLPVLEAAKARAQTTECLSNEKQLALACLEYVQDYDEYYPLGQFGGGCNSVDNAGYVYEGFPTIASGPNTEYFRVPHSVDGPCYDWTDAIYPYVKVEAVYVCPSPGNFEPPSTMQYRYIFDSGIDANGANARGSYVGNGMATGPTFTPGDGGPFWWPGVNPSSYASATVAGNILHPLAQNKIAFPSELLLLGDGAWNPGNGDSGYWGSNDLIVSDSTPLGVSCQTSSCVSFTSSTDYPDYTASLDLMGVPALGYNQGNLNHFVLQGGPWLLGRHAGLINVAFCDGHCKAMNAVALVYTLGPHGGSHYFMAGGG